jgi:hypothetical protein
MYKFIIFVFSSSIIFSSAQSTVLIKDQQQFNKLVDQLTQSAQGKVVAHLDSTGQFDASSDKNFKIVKKLSSFKVIDQTTQLSVSASYSYQDLHDPLVSVTCVGSDTRKIQISSRLFASNAKNKSRQWIIL